MQSQNQAVAPGSSQPLPQDPPDIHCPSCGRFVGPYTTCPYCGAAISGRIPLKVVKACALCLATLGLLFLWWLADRTEIPHLSVAEIESRMNFATVRIDGRIFRAITYDPVSQYIGFWVNDGTGEIHISAYRDTTRALLQKDLIPSPGDEVSIAGSLRIREDYAALTLNSPDLLTLHRPAPATLKSSAITLLDEGRRVALQGEITALSAPYTGLTLLTLQDESGDITIAINDMLAALTGSLPEVDVGMMALVTGTVTLYKGTPQVTLIDSQELTLLPDAPEPAPVVRQLSQITLMDLNSEVLVQGRVVAMEGIKGGLSATLDDGTAQIVLLLWSQVYNALDEPTQLDLGADITVYGEVSAYEGVLEIIPAEASDIVIQHAAPEIPWVSIDALTRADAGRVVRIRGVLGVPEGFSSGVKILLRDGSQHITVLLWSNIYQELKPRPVEDMLVEVTGIIDLYNGVFEIIPRSTHDVVHIYRGD